MPNYTGSMGFGEKYIQKLLGKCGTLDVADCIATVEELIRLGLSQPGRQVVQGGSHGGFLAAHRKSPSLLNRIQQTHPDEHDSHRTVPRGVQRSRHAQPRHLRWRVLRFRHHRLVILRVWASVWAGYTRYPGELCLVLRCFADRPRRSREDACVVVTGRGRSPCTAFARKGVLPCVKGSREGGGFVGIPKGDASY